MTRQLSDFDYMLDSYHPNSAYLEELRQEFVRKFSVNYIKNDMKLDDYVEGKKTAEGATDTSTFCYWLEYKLAALGSIRGSSVRKFGIWYSAEHGEYQQTKRWANNSVNVSFQKLKLALVKLIEVGKVGNNTLIEKAPFASIFKDKILSIYYPDKYLNIFSQTMLNYFLFQFDGMDNHKQLSKYEMQNKLIAIKMQDKVTRYWDNIKFGNYLYHLFPNALKLPSSDRTKVDNKVYFKLEEPKVPVEDKDKGTRPVAKDVTLIKLNTSSKQSKDNKSFKQDYLEKEKQKQIVGNKGEEIALKVEEDSLKAYPDLQRKIDRVSLISDSLGYDILSFEPDGTPKYIEVKSSSDEPKNKFDFILSENERQKAMKLGNYWIYRVFKVLDEQPIIYKIANPFKNDYIQLQPIKYRASVKIKLEK